MPEPQGDAPIEKDKDRTNFTNTSAARKSVSASRMDQTDNKSKAVSSGGSMTGLNSHAKSRSYK